MIEQASSGRYGMSSRDNKVSDEPEDGMVGFLFAVDQ